MLDQSFLPLAQNLIQLGVGCSFRWLLDFSVKFFSWCVNCGLVSEWPVPHMVLFSPWGFWLSSVKLRKEKDNKAIPLMMLMLLLSGRATSFSEACRDWAPDNRQPLRATNLGGSLN